MKYETPEVTELALAVNAIASNKSLPIENDSNLPHEVAVGAHQDWE
jgi:hypothetical protein